MKNKLIEINTKYTHVFINRIEALRVSHIEYLRNNFDEIMGLNDYEKYVFLYPYILDLSFFDDDEVIELTKKLGFQKYTPKVFISCSDLFSKLASLHQVSGYLLLFEGIYKFYFDYSLNVIKMNMALDLNIDLTILSRKINRQAKHNHNFPVAFQRLLENLNELANSISEVMPNFKFPISEKNMINSIFHTIKYSHKIELYNLYEFLLCFNEEAEFKIVHKPDFKCEFYDLLEILLREKELLSIPNDEVFNDSQLRRAKIKRVESLILS